MNEEHFLTLRKRYIESQFQRLNDVQKSAVFATEGPLLILAGAGSGKTTVLVNRIANLIRFGRAHDSQKIPYGLTQDMVEELEGIVEHGGAPSEALAPMLSEYPIYPYHILAITFTNKAAGELKSRLCAMLGEAGQDVNASTFHSACVRILRREAEHLGFPKSFTIYDSDDQQRAMKDVYKSLSVDDKFLPVKTAIGSIGRLKDKMISPKMALETSGDTRSGLIAKVYEAYQKRLLSAGAMDFDDLIYFTVKLMSENQEVREFYQNRYRYVLVDEYQDTSVAQFQLVYLLAGEHCNVCVVGDDDQSIYRFRGATIENILNFEKHFPGAKVIRLEQNYRSTSNILNAANCVIRNNQARKGKTLWTQNGEGDKISWYEAESEMEEAAHIVSVIGRNVKQGAKLRDHAILYRMNAQSGPVENYFARAGIPYKIVGGQRFYDRKEIKDMLAYMSIVANRRDDLRLRRIINEPARKLGAATVQNVADLAAQQGVSMLDIIGTAERYPQLGRAASALNNFYHTVYLRLVDAHDTLPLDSFVEEILDITGYRTMLAAEGETGETRLENIGQLVSSVKTYADQRGPEASLAGFLEEVALISDIDSYDEDADVVVMMTMHAAKGLEFDYVFLIGLEEGVFPSEMSRYSDEDLEEERRLCYVGITRAKKELYLSSAMSRMMFGQTKRNKPSRFLEEIDGELIQQEQSASAARMQAAREAYYQRQGGYHQGPYLDREYNRQPAAGGYGTGYGGYGTRVQRDFAGGEGRSASGSGARNYQAGFGHPQGRPRAQEPSRTVHTFGGASSIGAGSTAGTARPAASGGASYAPGDVVEHKVFGRGTVLKVTPVAGDHIVEIRFDTAGVKKTMANYAPLKKA